ncbi:outer membrane protein [Methylobacterium haplocladii]|uniref:Outer-membrane immunogenic protein n=1 Tax=Methylobacterium haplocladii TaxID=1176176 RepID=A0A512INJ5_9HYPH|nr:porin family protein [Methylobacterium haplocladii]GEO99284.1 outer-membrane immunogenic protein [Methylobacterium haplocladii]GLS59452.1 outer-membrane immunogenic protein [Methylobacterium haplocladii]
MTLLVTSLHRSARIGVLSTLGVLALGPAHAADLPLRSSLPPMEQLPPPAPPPVWGGFHVGLDAGYARTGTQHLKTSGTTPQEQALVDFGNLGAVAMHGSSFVLRGGLGYDVQFTPGSGFVVGVEADALYTNLQRVRTTGFNFGGSDIGLEARQTLDFLGTVRGRLGYAFGPVLVYGTGGFAYGGIGVAAHTTLSNAQYTGLYDGGRYTGIDTGFVYGGGIELMAPDGYTPAFLTPGRLSFKVEYLRYDLGKRNVEVGGIGPVFGPGGLTPTGHTADSIARTQGQLVTAGLAYRFAGLGY